jgi:hypothetical protein
LPSLRALRLVNSCFANSEALSAFVFRRIRLSTTPEHLERLSKGDVAQLAPYAKEVAFYLTYKFTNHSTEDFREVLLPPSLPEHHSDNISESSKLATKIYNDCAPYEIHSSSWDIFAKAWAHTLSTLPNVQSILLYGPYDNHRDFGVRSEGLHFVASVAYAVTAASIKPRDFTLQCPMDAKVMWSEMPDWTKLDFSQLRKLEFSPDMTGVFGDTEITENEADMMAAVLKRCAKSLEELNYRPPSGMGWPGKDVVALPNLKRLILSWCTVHGEWLKNWMAEMTSLQYLQLQWIEMPDERNSDWKHVLDAIRDHPTGIYVSFEDICQEQEGLGLVLEYHTDDFEKVLAEPDHPSRSLQLYLSGKIEFDESIMDMFERDWYPNDSDID